MSAVLATPLKNAPKSELGRNPLGSPRASLGRGSQTAEPHIQRGLRDAEVNPGPSAPNTAPAERRLDSAPGGLREHGSACAASCDRPGGPTAASPPKCPPGQPPPRRPLVQAVGRGWHRPPGELQFPRCIARARRPPLRCLVGTPSRRTLGVVVLPCRSAARGL